MQELLSEIKSLFHDGDAGEFFDSLFDDEDGVDSEVGMDEEGEFVAFDSDVSREADGVEEISSPRGSVGGSRSFGHSKKVFFVNLFKGKTLAIHNILEEHYRNIVLVLLDQVGCKNNVTVLNRIFADYESN